MIYDWDTMLPERAFRPRGFGNRGGMTLEGGGKGARPPDFTPLAESMDRVGDRMEKLGMQQLRFGARQYEQQLPLMQDLVNTNLEGQQLAMDLARETARERLKYRALEDELIGEVRRFNEQQARDQFAGQALADVNQAVGQQRNIASRNLQRMGINPNSGRFAQLNNQYALQGATLGSQAMNRARSGAQDRALQMKANAVALGRGLPQQTLSGISTAGSAGAQAGNIAQASAQPMVRGFQGAMGGLQGQMSAIGNQANILNQGYQNQLAYQAQNNQFMSDLGQLAGFAYGGGYLPFKEGGSVEDPTSGRKSKNQSGKGGLIRGKGTSTSDENPAINRETGQPILLSNKEYIMRGDAVRKNGKEFMDAINKGEITVADFKGKRKSALRST